MSRIGILKSHLDAHTLGITGVRSLIEESGYSVLVAPEDITEVLNVLPEDTAVKRLRDWLVYNEISSLGFTYRLDPKAGVRLFDKIYLAMSRLSKDDQCSNVKLFFAGLPTTAELITEKYGNRVTTFNGDETPIDTLRKLGIDSRKFPDWLSREAGFDRGRFTIAADLMSRGALLEEPAKDAGAAWKSGSLGARLRAISQFRGKVLCRAHAGPYFDDREYALAVFDRWVRQLSQSRELDILSIGTSQLTQQAFGEAWNDMPNGGGVPINSEFEFQAVKQSAGDMLVRSYSGTNNIPGYSRMLNRTIDCAWHALSIWWFNQTDGRGPLSLRHSIGQHLNALRAIAESGKPFEPNVGHHFAFRGADDLTSITATVLAVRMAAKLGVKHVILQIMLNTPKMTSGIADIVKYRTLMNVLAGFPESADVVITPQPRAGLAYFSPDLQKARLQLASVTGLMTMLDEKRKLPPIVHVVGYSEAAYLADPDVINESVTITRGAIREFSALSGAEMGVTADLEQAIEHQVRHSTEAVMSMLRHMQENIPDLLSQEGLYQVYKRGYFAVPDLWCCRDELASAAMWKTRIHQGSMCVVNDNGKPIAMDDRLAMIEEADARACS